MLQQGTPTPDDGENTAQPEPPPKNILHLGMMAIIRSTLAVLGFVLIPLGVIVALLTPALPIGLPIVITGVVLASRNSAWGRRVFQSILMKYPKLEKFAPEWLLKMIFGDDYVKPGKEEKQQVAETSE
jgi:hypothetical protein